MLELTQPIAGWAGEPKGHRPEQTVYQAALKAGANIIQPSLLDFLR